MQLASRVLGVSESGFYAWRIRALSLRAVRHVLLTDAVREMHVASRGTDGVRRVHAELTLGRGLSVCRETVALLMGRAGLQGVTGRPSPRPSPTACSSGSSQLPLVSQLELRGPSMLSLLL